MNKKKNILIVSPTSTHPTLAGNSACILAYSKYFMSCGHEVSFIFVDVEYNDASIAVMRSFWGERFFHFRSYFYRLQVVYFSKWFRLLTRGKISYNVDDWYPFGLSKKIKKLHKQHQFDIIWVNYIWLSKVFDDIDCDIKILDTHDVFSYKLEKTGLDWFSTFPAQEKKALDRADKIIAIQDIEGAFFEKLTKKQVIVGYRTFSYQHTPLVFNKFIMFFAGPNKHNVDAILWFIDKVYTPLKVIDPEIKLLIGGGICDRLPGIGPDILLAGKTDLPIDFYFKANIVINPVYQGTGLKIKTFEALSFGKLLITNSHNIIGAPLKDEMPVFIADVADDYIELIKKWIENYDGIAAIKIKTEAYINKCNELFKQRMDTAFEDRLK